jgi:pimeloyl-ACP methyl ester carboxylesterase
MMVLTLWTGLGMKTLPPERWAIPGWEIRWLEIEPPAHHERIDQWAERLYKRIPEDTTVLGGFSLGAQLALKHQAMAPDRFADLLLLSGFTHRRQWHVLLRFLRLLRVPHTLLLLPPSFLLRIIQGFMLLLPAVERRRFNIVLTLWEPEAWCRILGFLLEFKVDSEARVLQICGAEDIMLQPAAPAVRLPDAGHFLLPSHGSQIAVLLQDWWNQRQKTG